MLKLKALISSNLASSVLSDITRNQKSSNGIGTNNSVEGKISIVLFLTYYQDELQLPEDFKKQLYYYLLYQQ